MAFRDYFAGTIFVGLLIFGPVDDSWPYWLLIRSVYVIGITWFVWLFIDRLWKRINPTEKTELVIKKILSGIICITLILLAIIEAISKTHIENDRWIQTRDGMEPVGEYINVTGQDWWEVLLFVSSAILFFWFGVIKTKLKSTDKS